MASLRGACGVDVGIGVRLLFRTFPDGGRLVFRLALLVRGRCGTRRARPLIRDSAIMARAAKHAKLKRRMLTNLYNERPTWLNPAHRDVHAAVLAACAATDPDGDWREDRADDCFDTGPGQPPPEAHPLAAPRAATDRTVPGNLLRLSLPRAEAAH